MTNTTLSSSREYPLGTLGLGLMLLVARLVDLEVQEGRGIAAGIRRTVARVGLSGVSIIGTVIDGVAVLDRPARAPIGVPHAR